MQQYLELLKTIKEKGTYKNAARENMPGTTSLFGYQFRHNLRDGFPLLTTKKLSFKNIVTELLWFLRGDTNIKFLIYNGCNIWNEDAYRFYLKKLKESELNGVILEPYSLEEFIDSVRSGNFNLDRRIEDKRYVLGDCGEQYGKLWRYWPKVDHESFVNSDNSDDPLFGGHGMFYREEKIDQIEELINGLKNNPESRRHIITAWNPATLDDMALNACHCLVQFNCRPLTYAERVKYYLDNYYSISEFKDKFLEDNNIPKYYLDCQMYQRSADVFLGVPYNIASYALLTHILARICNMIPGDYIHTFGDVHIYDNHMNAVNEQLSRQPSSLPKLNIREKLVSLDDFTKISPYFYKEDFQLENYNPQSTIKAKLSTGLK